MTPSARIHPWPSGHLHASPLVRELLLTEQEGEVELRYQEELESLDPPFLLPGGLYFFRQAGSPIATPTTPTLFVFPGPYHVVEVLMANRGWGGAWSDGVNFDAMDDVNSFRRLHWTLGLDLACSILCRSRRQVANLYHTFTPMHTEVDARNRVARSHREHVWEHLGFPRSLAQSCAEKSSLSFPNFWSL